MSISDQDICLCLLLSYTWESYPLSRGNFQTFFSLPITPLQQEWFIQAKFGAKKIAFGFYLKWKAAACEFHSKSTYTKFLAFSSLHGRLYCANACWKFFVVSLFSFYHTNRFDINFKEESFQCSNIWHRKLCDFSLSHR